MDPETADTADAYQTPETVGPYQTPDTTGPHQPSDTAGSYVGTYAPTDPPSVRTSLTDIDWADLFEALPAEQFEELIADREHRIAQLEAEIQTGQEDLERLRSQAHALRKALDVRHWYRWQAR